MKITYWLEKVSVGAVNVGDGQREANLCRYARLVEGPKFKRQSEICSLTNHV